jgi:hypothetical protein
MRTVTYKTFWSYAGRGQTKRGTLADLVLDIPYLLPWGVIPPLHVLNEHLATGGTNGGMGPGTTWKPLTITPDEYTDLVAYLLGLDSEAVRPQHPYLYAKTLQVDPAFDHCTTFALWIHETAEKYRPLADWLQK